MFTDGVLLTCPTFYPPLVNGWKSLLVQLRFIIDGTSSCYRRRKANRISHWNHKILLWSNLFEENSSNNLLAYPHDLEQTVERKQCSYWRLTDSLLQSAIYTIVVQCVRVMLLVSLWLPWGSLQPPGLLHLDSSVIFVNWSLLGIVKVLLNLSFVHDFHCIPQTLQRLYFVSFSNLVNINNSSSEISFVWATAHIHKLSRYWYWRFRFPIFIFFALRTSQTLYSSGHKRQTDIKTTTKLFKSKPSSHQLVQLAFLI